MIDIGKQRDTMTAIESSIPEFATDRLHLRAVQLHDAPAYTRYFVDYDVIRHLSAANVPWPYPDNGVEDFIKTVILPNQGKDRWVWGLFLKDNPDEMIGSISLLRRSEAGNRGFWLARKHWGKGLMTEATHPVTHYAFNTLGFEKLVFVNAVGNRRSRSIKEKTGATLVATRPGKSVDPNYTEHEVLELTKEDGLKSTLA